MAGSLNYDLRPGYCSIRFYWIINSIQIHNKYVIVNPNPITIQLFWEKDIGQQILNGHVLWWNHGIPKEHLLSAYNLTYKLIVRKFW